MQRSAQDESANLSPDSGTTAFFLCLFSGNLGIHRFYTGNILTGILMLLTFGGLGIWTLIDLYNITQDKFEDGNDRRVKFKNENGRWPLAASVVGAIYFVGISIGLIVGSGGIGALFGALFGAAGIYCGYEVVQSIRASRKAETNNQVTGSHKDMHSTFGVDTNNSKPRVTLDKESAESRQNEKPLFQTAKDNKRGDERNDPKPPTSTIV